MSTAHFNPPATSERTASATLDGPPFRPPAPALPPPEPAPGPLFFRLDLSRGAPYTRWEYARKLLWRLVYGTVYRVVPNFWRIQILRAFGADLHETAQVRASVRIHHPWLLRMGRYSSLGDNVSVYNLGPIVIGEHTAISQNVHLCAGTHDWRNPAMPLVRSSITIGSGTWICADAFIGPGVRVGDNCVVAARAVVIRDAPDGTVVGGNPATVIRARPMDRPDGAPIAEPIPTLPAQFPRATPSR